MTYTSASHIGSLEEARNFFRHLVSERRVSFHPDNMFESYVTCEGGVNTFTLQECSLYNRLMDECFKVCEREGVDIYGMKGE